MRRLFAILMLGCLLLVTAGYHLVYYFQLAEAKQAMKKALLHTRPADLTKLVFTANEYQLLDWEDAAEFRYGGEMYDVLKQEKMQNKIVIWCLSDSRETAVLQQYLKTQRQSSEHQPSSLVQQIMNTHYLPSSITFLARPVFILATHFHPYLFTLPTADPLIITPPPQVC